MGKIVKNVNASKWFTVLADETCDISTSEQFSICVRYITNENIDGWAHRCGKCIFRENKISNKTNISDSVFYCAQMRYMRYCFVVELWWCQMLYLLYWYTNKWYISYLSISVTKLLNHYNMHRHYCQKDTKKQYLVPDLNLSLIMYRLYRDEYCTKKSKLFQFQTLFIVVFFMITI